MKLIARKPCSFGGIPFFIGMEVPAELVSDPEFQERLGVLMIDRNAAAGASDKASGAFTAEQVEKMIADAVAEAEKGHEERIAELQRYVAELQETETGAYDGVVRISVKTESDGENEQIMAISAKPEEIQQVFSIMQMDAAEGAKAIAEVQSENVLILLHAADNRKMVKNAAKDRADKLFHHNQDSNAPSTGNATTELSTGGATKGADA